MALEKWTSAAAVVVTAAAMSVVALTGAAPALADPVPFSCAAPTDFTVPDGKQLVAVQEGSSTATDVGNPSNFEYNAVGYDPGTHFLYGIASTGVPNGLVRIDSSGAASLLGAVAGLPTPASGSSYSSGAFDADGTFWVTSNDASVHTAYRIDVASDAVVGTLTLPGNAPHPADWTFARGYLWALGDPGLSRFDLSTGTVTTFAVGGGSTSYNAAWTSADGTTLNFLDSGANQVLRITLNSTPAVAAVSGQTLDGATAYADTNDGASCTPSVGMSYSGGAGTVGVAYSGRLTGVGGTAPYTWDATAADLPPGLALDEGTGAITGTPTQAGTYTFLVTATAADGQSGRHVETIRVYPGPFSCATPQAFVAPGPLNGPTQLLAITETSTPTATPIGPASPLAYNALAFDRADGYLYAIAGSPAAANHLLRIDSGGNVFDLGGVSGLPSPSSGQYASGTFDSSGLYWIVANSAGVQPTAYGIDVAGRKVEKYVRLDAAFAPTDWTYDYGYLWGLAGGTLYQVDLGTGHVVGVPVDGSPSGDVNVAWTYPDATLAFVSATQSANLVYRLRVQDGPLDANSVLGGQSVPVGGTSPISGANNDGASCGPALDLSTAPGTSTGTYRQPYSGAVTVTGGTAPYAWSSSDALPPGLALNSDGTITGTPTAAGTYTFTAVVTDSSVIHQSASESVTITIAPAPLTVTASSVTVAYGNGVASVGFTPSGFLVPADTFTTPPTCGTTVTSTSDPGQYPTSCSGAVAPNYAITYAPGSVTIVPAGQSISFTSPAPSPALTGTTYTPTFVAGGSGNPVVVTVDAASAPGACTAASGTVTFTGPGQCVIDANQDGNADYYPAGQVQQPVTVALPYRTSGFLSPVKNAPTLNTGKAGRTYPLKWQLQGANGQYVTSLDVVRSITVRSTSCGNFDDDPTSALATTSTGGTSLRYDTTGNQYVYNWQSPGVGCYSLFVTLTSGQVLTAHFALS